MDTLAISNTMLPRLASKLSGGQVAVKTASNHAFQDYRERKARNTLRRQDTDLDLFAEFLNHLHSRNLAPGDFSQQPEAWNGITWSQVVGFIRWMLARGYAIGSINIRLSTVKTYARLAMQSGTLSPAEYALIHAVSGYKQEEAWRVDSLRETAGIATRQGGKKAVSVLLTQAQVQALKEQPDTPQGRRDALLICLLADQGLRCGEAARLKLSDLNLQARELRSDNPEVGKPRVQELTKDTLEAVQAYIQKDAASTGALLRGSFRGGRLRDGGMSERAITRRVETLGVAIGIDGLSAQDLRHTWAISSVREGDKEA